MKPSASNAGQGLFARHADWWPPLLIVVLLFSTWSFLLKRAESDNARALREALTINRNVAQMVVNHTQELLGRVRLLNQISNGPDPDAVTGMVRFALDKDKAFLRLMQFDASGKLIFSSGKNPEPWLQEAATNFASYRRSVLEEDFAVGQAPQREYAQAWSMPIFYRPASAEGKYERFIVVLLDKGIFPQIFGDIVLGKGSEIRLLDNDNLELLFLREGRLESSGSTNSSLRYPFDEEGQTSRNDHHLYAYQKVAGSPVSVLVSRPRDVVLQENQITKRSYLGSALLLTVFMLGITVLWILATRRRQLLIRKLTLAQENNERLIDQIGSEKDAAYRLATYDKLTGLPNRMLFAELANRYVGRAQRLRGGFAMMFIDLDRFKPINDTYGHKAGDLLLVEVAQRLQECVRKTDTVSRYGGDEFVALVSDLRDNQDAAVIADKIIEKLSLPYTGIVDAQLWITPSIGIAFYPDDASEIDVLIRQADAAMYQAKGKGRATFAFADPELNRRNELRNRIEAALPAALENGEIHLHYQPKVSIADFRITGLEALARWNHLEMGKISPADFIPVAEKCGAIIELGEYVIAEVCQQLASWAQAGVPLVPVAVNVSSRQLRTPNIYDFIARTLEQYEIEPRFLEIEITETGVIDADELFIESLHRLADLGVLLAIDDFGTGYSGLSNLRNLPAKYLKIDRVFIQDIRNDINDAAIVSTTISLAHNLNLLAIAEGVETPEQVAHLKAARCDQAQGFLFSPPREAETIARLLCEKYIHVDMEKGGIK